MHTLRSGTALNFFCTRRLLHTIGTGWLLESTCAWRALEAHLQQAALSVHQRQVALERLIAQQQRALELQRQKMQLHRQVLLPFWLSVSPPLVQRLRYFLLASE